MHIRYEDIPPVFIKILESRGVSGQREVEEYLDPSLNSLPSPFVMKGMHEAVEKIASALSADRHIVLWGDYDVDGTTGTALLASFFRSIGRKVTWHIPDRVTDGYGLNTARLRKIGEDLDDFNFLLITIDCGISNFEEINELQRWGAEAIVTDHHDLPETLPPCIVLNPNQSDCGFNGQQLAGVGVAFYLAAGLRSHLRTRGFFTNTVEPNLKDFLAYTALGTIADMVPLLDTNRVLVRAGLEVLEQTIFPGLHALLAETGIIQGKIFSDDIGFHLGPKINAAGRMASADLAMRLLVSDDQEESVKLAKKLHNINHERKACCKENLEYALTIVDRKEIVADKCCIVSGPFHQGVLGIIASRLLEIFRVPVIVLTEAQTPAAGRSTLRGSCRSLENYNIMKILKECEDILLGFGGHAYAAGISLHQDDLVAFRHRCRNIIKSFSFAKSPATMDQHIDFSIQKALNEEHLEFFHLMEPMGKGNERPVFRDRNAKVIEYRRVGQNGEHLQATFRSDSGGCKGIGFNLGERTEVLKEERNCDVVYSVNPHRFNGRIHWQIHLLDLQRCS